YTQTTSLGLDLWDWGRRRSRYLSALKDRERERAQSRRALQGLDFRVATLFYSIRALEQDREVLALSIRTLEGALKVAKDFFGVGRSTQADVLVVEVSLTRVQYDERRLGDALADARDALRAILRLEPGAELTLANSDEPEAQPGADRGGDLEDRASGVDVFAPWENIAVERRPEVVAFRHSLEALGYQRRSLASDFLPTIGVFAQHEYSTTRSAFRNPNIFSGGVQASWELFSGFRTRYARAELSARVQELAAKEELFIADLRVEVRRSLRVLARAHDGVRVAVKGVEQSRENLRQVQVRMNSGKASGQELLEAESLARSEAARLVQARTSVRRAEARLRFVCGLDFDEDDDAPQGAKARVDSEVPVPVGVER
ncbi:MAG: TolC family protein, partial [Planctomycetota bacterium]